MVGDGWAGGTGEDPSEWETDEDGAGAKLASWWTGGAFHFPVSAAASGPADIDSSVGDGVATGGSARRTECRRFGGTRSSLVSSDLGGQNAMPQLTRRSCHRGP